MSILYDPDLAAKPAMNGLVFQQMRVGLDRPGRIHRHDLHIVSFAFRDMSQSAASNAAKAVDSDGNGHACLKSSEDSPWVIGQVEADENRQNKGKSVC